MTEAQLITLPITIKGQEGVMRCKGAGAQTKKLNGEQDVTRELMKKKGGEKMRVSPGDSGHCCSTDSFVIGWFC